MDKKVYLEAKNIKKGLYVLKSPFLEFQKWFSLKYEVKPLSFNYKILKHNSKPRLNIIWETGLDQNFFLDGFSEFEIKEKKILEKFYELTKDEKNYSTDGIFLMNSCFSHEYLTQCNDNIKEEEIQNLILKLSKFGVWKIIKRFTSAIFILYTEDQVLKYKREQYLEIFSVEYQKLIKKYDEFNYSFDEKISIILDSKNRIDKAYGGNYKNFLREM